MSAGFPIDPKTKVKSLFEARTGIRYNFQKSGHTLIEQIIPTIDLSDSIFFGLGSVGFWNSCSSASLFLFPLLLLLEIGESENINHKN